MIRRRLLAAAAAVLMGSAAAVAVGTPAQAWSYCSPIPSINGRFNIYQQQGYCGASASVPPVFDPCYTFVGTGYNDWAAAMWNRSAYKVTVFQSDNCNYAYAWMDLPSGNSDPDLVGNFLHRNISSMKFWP